MTDKQDLIREIHEYVAAHGGENTATHLLVQAASAIQTQAAELEAIGAGGVSGPLMGQPQEMPDLSALTERGAKAWAEVDVRELRGGFTAADMATAAAQGFRDGVASLSAPLQSALDVIERWARDAYVVCGKPSTQEWFEAAWKAEDADAYEVWSAGRASLSANAGEPRALNPRHIRKFLQALQAGEMSVSRAVEILDAWVGGYYEDEMVPPPPPDSCLIADDEFPMEIVRKLRSELAAAPPTAQAEGWVSVDERLPAKNTEVLICFAESPLPSTGQYTGHAVDPAGWSYPNESYLWPGESEKLPDGGAPTVTHWMPLPLPPTSAEGVEHG